MGKSIADEDLAYYHGTYNGKVCPPWMHTYIEEESDLVLEFGPLLADSNTGGHSREIASEKLISVHPDRVVCFGVTYTNVNITQCMVPGD
jgi:pyruvate decarboxylase